MKYELTVITPEETTGKDIIKIMSVIDRNGGTITKYVRDGIKILAYPITLRDRRYERGLYLYIEFEKDGSTTDICGDFNTRESIIRYLLVKADTREEDR